MEVDLTTGAISTIVSGGGYTEIFKPVLQVIGIECISTQTEVNSDGVVETKRSYKLVLSDGSVYKDVGVIKDKINQMIHSNQLLKGSIVRLTHFSCRTHSWHSSIGVYSLNVIHRNCVILGDPKPFSGNQTPLAENFIPPKLEEEPVDPDMNDHGHHADEYTASKQKRSSCSQTLSRKRQRQSSEYKEDDEIGACFEKLEKVGCGEGPMYDTAVLLFGESADYRKIWLHLKPNSCLNWVRNAGSKYGLLG